MNNIFLMKYKDINANYFYLKSLIKKRIFKDYKKALENIDQAINLDPYNALFFYVRADIKDQLNDNNGALKDIDQAINLDPSNAKYCFIRSLIKKNFENK